MQKTVSERLIEYIEYRHMRINAFEASIGVGNGYIRNMRQSLQPDKLEKIVDKYPDLNLTWLLTGRGTMLYQENNSPVAPTISSENEKEADNIPSFPSPCDDLSGVVDALKNALQSKDDEVQFLRQMLKDLQDSVRNFLAKNNVNVD